MKKQFKFIFTLLSILLISVVSQAKENVRVSIKDVGDISVDLPKVVNTTTVESKETPSKINKDVLYDDFKSLAQHSGVKLDTLLNRTFRVVSKTSQEIWDIIVRQQRINAIYHLSLLLLEIWLLYRWFIFLGYYNKQPEDDKTEGQGVLLVLSMLCLIAFGIYNSVYMIDVYTGLFNPKYAALQELLRLSGYLK